MNTNAAARKAPLPAQNDPPCPAAVLASELAAMLASRSKRDIKFGIADSNKTGPIIKRMAEVVPTSAFGAAVQLMLAGYGGTEPAIRAALIENAYRYLSIASEDRHEKDLATLAEFYSLIEEGVGQ